MCVCVPTTQYLCVFAHVCGNERGKCVCVCVCMREWEIESAGAYTDLYLSIVFDECEVFL